MCDRLEKLVDETGQRILIHGPPQYGKSIVISQRFPAYAIGKRPDIRVRLGCYNETHAQRFSAINIEVMRSPEYKEMFPAEEAQLPSSVSVMEWSTIARKRKMDAQPSFVPLGIGSGFTGLGADILIIDDPYKNREEAFSKTISEKIWNWWKEVVIPRLNPQANVVVMFHRWKEDDLAGRLMEQGGWESIRFPAIGDGAPDDKSGVAVGAALSPRYSVPFLQNLEQKVVGTSVFASLWQGTPRPREGSMFKYDWFKQVDGLPANTKLKIVRYVDKAFTESGGAYTAMLLMAMETTVREIEQTLPVARPNGAMALGTARKRRIIEKRFFILGVVRGQWGSGQRDEMIRKVAYDDRQKHPSVKMHIEQEPGATGRDSNQILIKSMPGLSVFTDHITGEKEIRASDLASQAEIGNVFIVRRPATADNADPNGWIPVFLDEITTFPGSKYKDQVDAASGAFNVLNKMPTTDHITADQVRGFSIY